MRTSKTSGVVEVGGGVGGDHRQGGRKRPTTAGGLGWCAVAWEEVAVTVVVSRVSGAGGSQLCNVSFLLLLFDFLFFF